MRAISIGAMAMAAALVVSASTTAGAAEPAAAPTTLLNFLGIPQGIQSIRDATVNRNGNFPQLERKDPILRIADPANLESDNPAIKTAAKIKKDQDLAKQKIKGIKHLSSVGCGCYPGVAEALLAALDDCTEEVRYEAVVAFCEAAGTPCAICGSSCCNAQVMNKLHEMAFGTDEKNCPIESSCRVRAAASAALNACRNKMPPGTPTTPEPIPDESKPKETPVEAASGTSLFKPAGFATVSQAGDGETSVESESQQAGQDGPTVYPRDGAVRSVGGKLGLVAFQEPTTPTQPFQPFQPPFSGEGAGAPESAGFGNIWGAASTQSSLERVSRALENYGTPAMGVATQQEATAMAPTSVTSLLAQSSTVQSVDVQRRSPVSMDPNIRGYKAGQIYTQADGVYWTPARLDLDNVLTSIDPGMIQDVVVIPGPYGLRYGPGFSFIDVVRAPTPRYQCGSEFHFDTSGDVRTNGGQVYGRETVFGGGGDYGFRVSYGHRRGSDYTAGDGQKIPSSYENRDAWGQFSYDINPNQRVDFSYQRLDQTDTEYPCQFFDVNFLVVDGFQLRLTDDDPSARWTKFTVDGWYNRTRFEGDTSNSSNPNYPVMQRVEAALDHELEPYQADYYHLYGDTHGALANGGFRTRMTFGEQDETRLSVGTDFRYLSQQIVENFALTPNPEPPPEPSVLRWTTNMPHAWCANPGVYAELASPLTDAWTATTGVRGDFVGTRARASDLRDGTQLEADLSQDDGLWAFYLTNEFKVNKNWLLTAGFGQAQRPPTMVERYADGLFLSLAQSGFCRMIGDPTLRPERNWQIDLGLDVQYEAWRGKANLFHAWVNDYITWKDDSVFEFADARLLKYVNTDLATLSGFELAGEYDLYPRLSAFGKMSFVEGRDQVINAPLPAIPPLDTTLGLRLHDTNKGRRWGIELASRIVNTQDRLGTIRLLGTSTVIEERTPGFSVWNLRGYYNWTKNFSLIAGIDNLFDKNYQEHLDLRLLTPTYDTPPTYSVSPTRVLSPGFTPYFALNWVY